MRLSHILLVIGALGLCAGPAWSNGAPKDPPLPGEIAIQVSPGTVSLASQGTWVTIHADIRYAVVAGYTVEPNGVPVKVVKADTLGELVAKFPLDAVKQIIAPPSAELVLVGQTRDSTPFIGRTTINVVAAGR